ncbi:hypothetical protein Tco_1325629 [Tanacetum coccineum]
MSLQSILTLYLLLFNLSHGRGSGFVIVELERVCRGIGLWGKVRMSCGRYLRGGLGLKLWGMGRFSFGGYMGGYSSWYAGLKDKFGDDAI